METERRPLVLVVDDDVMIAEIIARFLGRAGYDVRVAHDGIGALKAVDEEPVSLVILDVMLPRLSGLEVLRRLRTRSGARPAVVLLTARGEEKDRVNGLGLGADDYVVKPFSPRELVARVDAILRRAQTSALREHEAPRQIDIGPVCIDVAGRRATFDGAEIKLTQMEFDLLLYLARSPGTVLTRGQLMQGVWGHDARADTSTVTVHVKRLRDKLRPAGGHQLLQTVHGIGYRMNKAPEAPDTP